MGFLNEIFGRKPNVPQLEKLDVGAEQQKAVANNQAVMPAAQSFVASANLFSQGQINSMLEQAGGGSLLKDSAGAIDKMVKGELPMSDVAQSTNASVARSFEGGTGGSGMMRNLVARDLGLKELDVISKGLSSAESWMRTTAALFEPSMINLSSMFINPLQQYQIDNEQNVQQFQRSWMQEQVQAMPDPVLGGINAEVMQLASSFLGGLGSKMGGKMGGGGGGGLGGYTADFSDLPGVESAG